jgi:hypothetical protein
MRTDVANFPGINKFIDAATEDGMTRGDARSDSSLQTAGDLIGQAYAMPEHAAGIINAAEGHVRSLQVRARIAREVLEQAKRDLVPKSPKS